MLLMLSFVLAPARGRAEDTYTIKNKETAKGDKIQSNKQVTESTMIKLEDSQGNVLQEKNETITEKYIYQETLLEKSLEKNKATRLRRAYDQAEIARGDDKETLPYQGKTVLIEFTYFKQRLRIMLLSRSPSSPGQPEGDAALSTR